MTKILKRHIGTIVKRNIAVKQNKDIHLRKHTNCLLTLQKKT
jgi:hypothetical protein